jgi:hypothetical protein
MVAWTKRKQGLHDKVAETLVVLGPAPVGGGIRTLIVFGVLFLGGVMNPSISREAQRTPGLHGHECLERQLKQPNCE